MSKKMNLKAALSKSVKDESSHIEKRFALAEEMIPSKKEVKKKVEGFPVPTPTREKVVRDTYSMPMSDYELIQTIQQNWLRFGIRATRSEIVRAGILSLSMSDKNQVEKALAALVKLKPGRVRNH